MGNVPTNYYQDVRTVNFGTFPASIKDEREEGVVEDREKGIFR